MDAYEREGGQKMNGATSAQDWKKDKGPQPLKVPSGNTCLVRQKPLTAFVKYGQIPNSVMPVVQKALRGELKKEDIVWTDEQLIDLMGMMDAVVVECVAEPRVSPIPPCITCHKRRGEHQEEDHEFEEEERDPEKLYVDEVDDPDKIAVFDFIIAGAERYSKSREEQGSDVAAVPEQSDVEDPAKQPS